MNWSSSSRRGLSSVAARHHVTFKIGTDRVDYLDHANRNDRVPPSNRKQIDFAETISLSNLINASGIKRARVALCDDDTCQF
jgi:hypothetical protein